MTLPYLFANAFSVTLTAAITTTPASGTQETISVSGPAPAALQAAGQFPIVADSEIMLVTGGTATNGTSWTVLRGQEGTATATHLVGTSVTNDITAAALLGLTASSSGAGAQTANAGRTSTVAAPSLRDFISVKDAPFSAVGDGVTNDSAAFTSTKTNGGTNATIWVPQGTYSLTAGLTLDVAGQEWRAHSAATITIPNATNVTVVTINASGVSWTGGIIDGNSATNSGAANVGVFFNVNGIGTRMEGTTVQNAYQGGFLIYSSDVTIIKNRINTRGTGIYSQPGTQADMFDIRILDNRVDKSSQAPATAVGYGIQIHGGPATRTFTANTTLNNSQITAVSSFINLAVGNAISGTNIPTGTTIMSMDSVGGTITMSQVASATATGVTVTVNYMQRGVQVRGNIVRLPSSPTSTMIGIECWGGCPGASVNANHTYGGTMGISMDRCDNSSVSGGNECNGATSNGIEIASCYNATCQGNVIDGQGVLGGGIVLDGGVPTGSSRCSIIGNTIRYLNTGGNSKYLYCIGGDHNSWTGNIVQVSSSAGATGLYLQNSPHNSIQGNVFVGNNVASYAITFDGSNSNGTVAGGNQFDSWTGSNVTVYVGVSASTSAALSTAAAITSIPVNALGAAIAAGTVWVGSPANQQSQAFTTTGAASGATSIPVTSQTPNFAYPSGSNITLTTPVVDTVSIGVNKHITGIVATKIGGAIWGLNCPITPASPISTPAYAATISPDSHQAKVWRPGVLTGNVTISSASSNAHAGQELWIILQQDATGTRTVTWGTGFVNTPTTNTAANAYTTGRFVHDGTNWVGV